MQQLGASHRVARDQPPRGGERLGSSRHLADVRACQAQGLPYLRTLLRRDVERARRKKRAVIELRRVGVREAPARAVARHAPIAPGLLVLAGQREVQREEGRVLAGALTGLVLDVL